MSTMWCSRPLVRDVVLLVGERAVQVLAPADEDDAAGLRQVQPLVRVERHGVGPLEPGEERPGRRRRRRGDAVRAVDVEPDAALLADVGESVDRVDGARQRRPGGRDHRNGRDAGRDVGVDRLRDRLGAQPALLVERKRRARSSEPSPSSSAARTTE